MQQAKIYKISIDTSTIHSLRLNFADMKVKAYSFFADMKVKACKLAIMIADLLDSVGTRKLEYLLEFYSDDRREREIGKRERERYSRRGRKRGRREREQVR